MTKTEKIKRAFNTLMSYGYNPFRFDYRYTKKGRHYFKDRVTGERISVLERKKGGVGVRKKKDEVKEIEFQHGHISLDYLMKEKKPDRCECGGKFTMVSAYLVCNKCGKYGISTSP